MKILLVTRGSQGDVYPYLTLAAGLMKKGHTVTISLPEEFEEHAVASGLTAVYQKFDSIGELMDGAAQTKQKMQHLLKWMRRVIDMQFEQLIPLLEQHDLLIASNTEFAAVSLAEYCNKPVIRTAYGPFIPGNKIPPPALPFPKPNRLFTPAFFLENVEYLHQFHGEKNCQ